MESSTVHRSPSTIHCLLRLQVEYVIMEKYQEDAYKEAIEKYREALRAHMAEGNMFTHLAALSAALSLTAAEFTVLSYMDEFYILSQEHMMELRD